MSRTITATITAKQVVANPYFSLICFLSLFFVTPRYGGFAMMVVSAGILSVFVAVLPEQFRSRSGSLTVAIGLVAAMWAGAAVITALTLMGAVRD